MSLKEVNKAPIKYSHQVDNLSDDVIDLRAFFGTIFERKLLIVSVTAVFALVGIAIAVLSTPVYKADAMIQVEDSNSTMPGLDGVSSFYEGVSEAVTEIELLKSRSVIGEAVDILKLDIVATPKLYPYIGERSFRLFNPTAVGDVAEPRFGAKSYAWGGEKIDVLLFDVPQNALGTKYILQAVDNQQFKLLNANGDFILQGKVGEEVTNGDFTLKIETLVARTGTEFVMSRNSRLSAIISLQSRIGASEKGKDSGIINLSFQNKNPEYSKKILNTVAQVYVKRNIDRNSAEAKKSLDFLAEQLPDIKTQLEKSEEILNNYQISQKSVNIELETSAILTQIVVLNTKLQGLELNRLEASRLFKQNHPNYRGLVEQIAKVQDQRDGLSKQVLQLPETQQELLRLMRDVKVGNAIYTMLLGKMQELDIARAGTVGNVRIIDVAAVDTSSPVAPKKRSIVVMATLLGGMLAIVIVLLQKAFNTGITKPSEIEGLGFSVYATIPYSSNQKAISDKISNSEEQHQSEILAILDPADLAVEAFRTLRTSLHFAMFEAEDNVLILSGPSSDIGKSFISANLAAVLVQTGKKVLLIDGDMRRGDLHKVFGMKPEIGLSEFLSQQITSEQSIIKASGTDGLDLVSRGKIPPNPSELLMHRSFSKFVEEMRSKYDFVIIDTPPALAVVDATIIGGVGGCLLLVARYEKNSIKELEHTNQRFKQNGLDIKGVILNGVSRKSQNAYDNAGYYIYDYTSAKG
ncbi:polysaccharide biosynthesis tyrosine autokinase [Paraglaciecola psychrophila]|uniref:Tyrosine-protein kinase n=1 Tax=Paraglaciecola psychrophila 170 TaxID=1129794 RepID=K7A3B7_9ALTE|nr:polysaccharide biosynthesis tyrosine autokinase [Paraglaciecola psychrophila]AGH45545.1 tyrosine-protein kinase [Paraglaciecola psychrophila 170]GAC36857.1 tyrosine-protein kinase wzc [Paraglaciecola psychrophila 170]